MKRENDENERTESGLIEDLSSVKSDIDNTKNTVEHIKQIKQSVDGLKAASKVAPNTAKAAEVAKVAASAQKTVEASKMLVNGAKLATGALSGPAGWVTLAASLATNKKTKEVITGIVVIIAIFFLIIQIILLSPAIMIAEKAAEVIEQVIDQGNIYKDFYNVGNISFNDEEDFWNMICDEYQISAEDLSSVVSLYGAENEMNLSICKDIIDNAIDWSFKAPRDGNNGGYWTKFVKSDTTIGRFFESTSDWLFNDNENNAAYYWYLQNQYPYTLKHNNFDYYTIEDYMEGNIPEDELNNDINYAEIISIICMAEGMRSDEFTFKNFYNILMKKEVRRHFAELSPTHKYYANDDYTTTYDSLEQMASNLGYQNVEAMQDEAKKRLTFKITEYMDYEVFPYGLFDMFTIAGVDYHDANFVNTSLDNIEMIDYYENSYRSYITEFSSASLGIGMYDSRDSRSKAFYSALPAIGGYEGQRKEGTKTGRSEYSYVDLESYLYTDVYSLEEWDSENKVYENIIYSPTGKAVILDFNSDENTPYNNIFFNSDYSRNYENSNSHSFYIKQTDYPNDYRCDEIYQSSIAREGCIDCCYTMCAQYLLNTDISIRAISKAFCIYDERKNDVLFDRNIFLSSFGLCEKRYERTFNQSAAVEALDKGSPVIICLNGRWSIWRQKSEGTHFITIIGYDDNYFYVLDPATNYKKIPIEAFSYAPISVWYLISDSPTSSTFLEDNTIEILWPNKYRFAYVRVNNNVINYNGIETLRIDNIEIRDVLPETEGTGYTDLSKHLSNVAVTDYGKNNDISTLSRDYSLINP